MQNTFFLLFVLIRQRFYKIVSHIISIYFQEVYPTLCNQLLIFSHRDIVASLGNLNWPSTESGENFPSLDNILLWPRAEARPWVFDTISSGMGKLLRNYRLLIVNKRSRQEKTRHFCQGNITRLWVLAGNRGAWTWSARILLTSPFRSTARQQHAQSPSLAAVFVSSRSDTKTKYALELNLWGLGWVKSRAGGRG